MADRNVTAELDLTVGPRALDDFGRQLDDNIRKAEKLQAIMGSIGTGGGGGGGGGTSGGVPPGGPRGGGGRGGGGGAGGGPQRGSGRGIGQAPVPPTSGAGMAGMMGGIPLVGGLMAAGMYGMFRDYERFQDFRSGQYGVAPLVKRPVGNQSFGLGYMPQELTRMQMAMTKGAGAPVEIAQMRNLLKWTRGFGLGAEDIGGFMRPFQEGAGLGGIAQGSTHDQLARSVAMGFRIGFTEARLPEFLQGLAASVTSAGQQGLQTSQAGALRLMGALQQRGFSGSRAVAGAGAFMGLRGQVMGMGGDPLMTGLLMRQAGLGQGKGPWEALLDLQKMSQDPGKFAGMVLKATEGFGHTARRFYMQKVLGGQLSPQEIEDLLSGDLTPEDIELGREDPDAAVDRIRRYGGASRHKARKARAAVRRGAKAAKPVQSLEETMMKIQDTMNRVMIPLANGIVSLVDAIQKLHGALTVEDIEGPMVRVPSKGMAKQIAAEKFQKLTGMTPAETVRHPELALVWQRMEKQELAARMKLIKEETQGLQSFMSTTAEIIPDISGQPIEVKPGWETYKRKEKGGAKPKGKTQIRKVPGKPKAAGPETTFTGATEGVVPSDAPGVPHAVNIIIRDARGPQNTLAMAGSSVEIGVAS